MIPKIAVSIHVLEELFKKCSNNTATPIENNIDLVKVERATQFVEKLEEQKDCFKTVYIFFLQEQQNSTEPSDVPLNLKIKISLIEL